MDGIHARTSYLQLFDLDRIRLLICFAHPTQLHVSVGSPQTRIILDKMGSFYCDLFGQCEDRHEPLSRRRVSRSVELTYQKQILRSYQWIFGNMEDGSSCMGEYYDIPLPWWLVPLESPQELWEASNHQERLRKLFRP
jgi:hypothetical protein